MKNNETAGKAKNARKLVEIGSMDHTRVYSMDEKKHGANHVYEIRDLDDETLNVISFQKGGKKEEGSIKGIFNEDLLVIVLHRLLSFQETSFSCDHNERAIEGIKIALESLRNRTKDRIKRGVLGKHRV